MILTGIYQSEFFIFDDRNDDFHFLKPFIQLKKNQQHPS